MKWFLAESILKLWTCNLIFLKAFNCVGLIWRDARALLWYVHGAMRGARGDAIDSDMTRFSKEINEESPSKRRLEILTFERWILISAMKIINLFSKAPQILNWWQETMFQFWFFCSGCSALDSSTDKKLLFGMLLFGIGFDLVILFGIRFRLLFGIEFDLS